MTGIDVQLNLSKEKSLPKNIFPVMNIYADIKDGECDEYDTIKSVINNYEMVKPALGNTILYSDGSIKKGYDGSLITIKGVFNISRDDTDRFYIGDGTQFLNNFPFFFNNKQMYFGYETFVYKDEKTKSGVEDIYESPIYNINGLYKANNINETIGYFNEKPNIKGKTKFLESFLKKEDKCGYKSKDMIVNDPKTRLKLLEVSYKNNAHMIAEGYYR